MQDRKIDTTELLTSTLPFDDAPARYDELLEDSGALAATSDVDSVVCGGDNDAVVIASRHDSHADLVCRALAAQKHVFVEKPLACSLAELEEVERVLAKGVDRVLMVDFNRRFSPLTRAVGAALAGRGGPVSMVMTVNAGRLPADSWIMDEAEGGSRVISEVCHFIDLMVAVSGSLVSSISGLGLGVGWRSGWSIYYSN
jgi:predicted dehydrogenase